MVYRLDSWRNQRTHFEHPAELLDPRNWPARPLPARVSLKRLLSSLNNLFNVNLVENLLIHNTLLPPDCVSSPELQSKIRDIAYHIATSFHPLVALNTQICIVREFSSDESITDRGSLKLRVYSSLKSVKELCKSIDPTYVNDVDSIYSESWDYHYEHDLLDPSTGDNSDDICAALSHLYTTVPNYKEDIRTGLRYVLGNTISTFTIHFLRYFSYTYRSSTDYRLTSEQKVNTNKTVAFLNPSAFAIWAAHFHKLVYTYLTPDTTTADGRRTTPPTRYNQAYRSNFRVASDTMLRRGCTHFKFPCGGDERVLHSTFPHPTPLSKRPRQSYTHKLPYVYAFNYQEFAETRSDTDRAVYYASLRVPRNYYLHHHWDSHVFGNPERGSTTASTTEPVNTEAWKVAVQRRVNYSSDIGNYLTERLKEPKEINPYYYGVELEVSSDATIPKLLKPLTRPYCFCKADSSITESRAYTYEIVTVPASLKAHKRHMFEIFNAVGSDFDDSTRTTNGMHVHVDYQSFGKGAKPPKQHLRNFIWFWTAPSYRYFHMMMSERDVYTFKKYANSIADYYTTESEAALFKRCAGSAEAPPSSELSARKILSFKHHGSSVFRSPDLDIGSPSTVEIRSFKGIATLATTYKNLELIDASVHFTAQTNFLHNNAINFIKFVNDQPSNKYRYLKEFIKKIGIQELCRTQELTSALWHDKARLKAYDEYRANPFPVSDEYVQVLNDLCYNRGNHNNTQELFSLNRQGHLTMQSRGIGLLHGMDEELKNTLRYTPLTHSPPPPSEPEPEDELDSILASLEEMEPISEEEPLSLRHDDEWRI